MVLTTPPVLHIHAVPLSERCTSKYVFVGKGTCFYSPFRHQPACGSTCGHLQQYRDWLIARCLREDGFVDQLVRLQGKTLLDADVRPSEPGYRGHAHVLADFVGSLQIPGPDHDFYSPRRNWRLDVEVKWAQLLQAKLMAGTISRAELYQYQTCMAWLQKRAPARHAPIEHQFWLHTCQQRDQPQANPGTPAAPAKKTRASKATAIYELRVTTPCILHIAA